jgi:hypothetical protein
LFVEGQAMPKICEKLRYDEDMPFVCRADKNPMHVEKSNGAKKPQARAIILDRRINQMRGYK